MPAVPTRDQALDVLERVGWTAAQAFVAQLIASGWFTVDGVTDLSIAQKAGIAGIAAALSVIKGIAATFVGSGSAATLPTSVEPIPPDTIPSVEAIRLDGGRA